MNVDHKVLALVGPNEAGKSTVLDAMERLNGGTAMQPSDYPRAENQRQDTVVEGWFLLRDDDHAIIDHIPHAGDVRWLIQAVDSAGTVSSNVHPRLHRDKSARQDVTSGLEHASRLTWAKDSRVNYNGPLGAQPDVPTSALLTQLAIRLKESPAGSPSGLTSVAEALRQLTFQRAGRLADGLSEVASEESQPDPNQRVCDLLRPRIPRFVKFQEADRMLLDEYDLNAIANTPPQALVSFLQLAGTSVPLLRSAMLAQDTGASLEEILEAANGRLHEEFSPFWSQSKVEVQLRVHNRLSTPNCLAPAA